jgi:uncharacterized protein YrrD
MLDITNDTGVYTAHDEHVGTVDRVVLDPSTRAISHVVVGKGILFREDRLVPISDIATATAERINLRRDVGVDDLLPFVEQQYVPLADTDADRPAGPDDKSVRFAMPLSGPVGEVMPTLDAELVPVEQRNIPDRLTALEIGAPVLSSDHRDVGRLERVVTSAEGQPMHIVVEEGGLMPERRAIPMKWVTEIAENAVALDVTREMVEAIRPLEPDD